MDMQELSQAVYDLRVPMLRLAVSLLRHRQDAEDAVSDAVVRMLTQSGRLRDEHAVKAWALRITTNCCYDLMRRAKREKSHRPPEEDGFVLFEEPGGSLFEQLRMLPPPLFQVLSLYYYEGYSTLEIARVLSIPSGTVRMRLSRGRKQLKALLEEEENV